MDSKSLIYKGNFEYCFIGTVMSTKSKGNIHGISVGTTCKNYSEEKVLTLSLNNNKALKACKVDFVYNEMSINCDEIII